MREDSPRAASSIHPAVDYEVLHAELSQLREESSALRERCAELEAESLARMDAAAFLASVLAAVPAFIIRADASLKISYANRYQPGLTPETVIGRSIFEFVPAADREIMRVSVERAIARDEPVSYPSQGTGPHGAVHYYETIVAPVHEADGKVGICLAAVDVTAHKRRAEALVETEAKLELARQATGLGLWSWDVARNEIIWDEGMRRLHGSEATREPALYIERFVHPADRGLFERQLRELTTEGTFRGEPYRIVRTDGAIRWVIGLGQSVLDEHGKPTKVYGGTLDVTPQRELEEQLRHAHKLEAIGSLTAGIAHNFNNLLTVILPTLDLTAKLLPKERAPLVAEAMHAAKRAAEMVQQLMTYAGQSRAADQEPHAIGAAVQAAVAICKRAFDASIAIEERYASEALVVACNPAQLEQVIVNLLMNARDALQDVERADRRVVVTTTVGQTLIGQTRTPCALIEIRDNGVGMSEAVRARAFEPFFTSKGAGRGTGLGLATSFAIVRDHGGELRCESEQGVGTTLTVVLPLSDRPPIEQVAPPMRTVTAGRCVLIVDDELAVRTTLQYVLAEAGLTVLLAHSGESALQVLEQHRNTVDVVLLDRSMPGGSGESYVPRMRALSSRARIVFLSGQAVEPRLVALVDGVVQKPVTGPVLLDAIERALRPSGVLPATNA